MNGLTVGLALLCGFALGFVVGTALAAKATVYVLRKTGRIMDLEEADDFRQKTAMLKQMLTHANDLIVEYRGKLERR